MKKRDIAIYILVLIIIFSQFSISQETTEITLNFSEQPEVQDKSNFSESSLRIVLFILVLIVSAFIIFFLIRYLTSKNLEKRIIQKVPETQVVE